MLPIASVLFPTDFSRSSEHAFQVACALARDYDARLTILHVKPPPPPMINEFGVQAWEPAEDKRPLLEKLNQIRPANPLLRADHRLAEGDPASEIIRQAEKADLVVMGTHGRSGLARLLMGSVAEAVLRGASCPVLTVKAPAAEGVEKTEAADPCLA